MIPDRPSSRVRNRLAAASLIVGALVACSNAGRAPVVSGPSPAVLEARLAEAGEAVNRGSYTGFKRAAAIYKELSATPRIADRVAEAYIRTLILLLTRERQIGIAISATPGTAQELLKTRPRLSAYAYLVDQVQWAAMPMRGIQTDIRVASIAGRTQQDFEKAMAEAKARRAELRAKAAAADFDAYCYIFLYASMASMREGEEDFSPLFSLHPESRLMRYLNATRYRRENPDLLKKLVEDDPEFYEAHFHLGELALAERAILTAEKEFLKAEPGLQDSPQVSIYLASLYTVTEEYEKSLAYYDRTLALSPEYRDALLGKGISLSSLGRYREAIEPLNRMVELGNWLMGEANYWLAWNRHALKEDAAAQFHIDESKGRLPTNSEVFGLAGTIALELGQTDKAEAEYKEALKYNGGNTEALFGLGRISDGRERWRDAALYYDQAAEVVGRNETAVEAKIAEIKAAPVSEERRARMLEKKEGQLRITRATRATAFYNAAASWLNAGQPEKARPAAERAASHAQFKERAEALLLRMKQK
jgi:tetratricopeptide (TPR) repeat protein